MTTPDERMRALRWGRELLVAIQQEIELKPELRNAATRLAQQYPTPEALAAVLDGATHALPQNFATIIEEAGVLFRKVEVDGSAPPGLRRHALYTLRHFPLPRTVHFIEHALSVGRVDEWLAHENVPPNSTS